jgi:hypothetical protein
MCALCGDGLVRRRLHSQRQFLRGVATTGIAAGLGLFAARPAAADAGDMPSDSGGAGRRYLIRGGSVMSMDPNIGDFAKADVLVEGKKIVAIGANVDAGDAAVIDATGRIVMPGFIDTHHHQFETALRSFLADGVLIKDGTPTGEINYYEYILVKFAPAYRPEDVYINELFGSLSAGEPGDAGAAARQSRLAGAAERPARAADDARRPPLRHSQRRKSLKTRQQDGVADARQGGGYHHPRRHGDQRSASQPSARRGRVVDGSHERRECHRRRQDPQVERQALRR